MAADCSEAERSEFERWRELPQNAAAFSATEKLWDDLGSLAGHPNFERLSDGVLARNRDPRRGNWRQWSLAASVLIVLVGAGTWFTLTRWGVSTTVYSTLPGERREVVLADGSHVALNGGTEIEVRLESRRRRIDLRRGEVLVTAAHDAQRPLQVTTGGSQVTAIGTRFQVRNEAQNVTVTLLEGRIAVDRRDSDEHVLLGPGEQVRFGTAQVRMLRRMVDPLVVSSWSEGRLRFHGTPLSEAVDEINRYSAVQIRLADPALAQVPISGTFALGDSASVVAAIQALFGAQVIDDTAADPSPHITLVGTSK